MQRSSRELLAEHRLPYRIGPSNIRCACVAKLVCVSVGRSVSPHVFSGTVAVVDTKRMYERARGTARVWSGVYELFTWGAKIIYSYYTRCALIKDCQRTEETCHYLETGVCKILLEGAASAAPN